VLFKLSACTNQILFFVILLEQFVCTVAIFLGINKFYFYEKHASPHFFCILANEGDFLGGGNKRKFSEVNKHAKASM